MKTIRLLTIGNSFSVNALTWLNDIAASAGEAAFDTGEASLGGCSLEKHWNLATYTDKHPEYKTYDLRRRPDGTAIKANLQDALTDCNWDFITLQQVSHKSWRRDSFQPYLDNLLTLIHELAPTSRVMLHQTWAYRSDAPYFPQNGLNQELMFAGIRENYRYFSKTTGCGILPSGEAIQAARQDRDRRFTWPDPDFDYHDPGAAPALPRQDHSLAVGWHWSITGTPDGIPELRLDGRHLNESGCYLAGCVWFERLTGMDVTETNFVPEGIDRNTAVFLRRVAHETVGAHAG